MSRSKSTEKERAARKKQLQSDKEKKRLREQKQAKLTKRPARASSGGAGESRMAKEKVISRIREEDKKNKTTSITRSRR